jgi:hypothetical protein
MQLINLQYFFDWTTMDFRSIADKNLLFLTLTGSHAYGMNTATSDKDYRGVFFLPPELLMSPFFTCEQVEKFRDEKDSVVFELKKYFKLLIDQNPNILELLWVDDKFVSHNTVAWKFLHQHREALLSTKAKFTFSGYAIAQLKRIKGHNKWINNPQPQRRPKEIDFLTMVYNQTTVKDFNKIVPIAGVDAYHLGGDLYGLVLNAEAGRWHDIHEALVARPVTEKGDAGRFDFIVKFNKQLYKEAVDNWQHYWTWKKERNEARSALEEQFGYDTKHAAHLIRLLRMGNEVLDGKGVIVLRPDAQELLDIRNGKYKYEELVSEAEGLERRLDEAYKTSKVQHEIDLSKANALFCELYMTCWEEATLYSLVV